MTEHAVCVAQGHTAVYTHSALYGDRTHDLGVKEQSLTNNEGHSEHKLFQGLMHY